MNDLTVRRLLPWCAALILVGCRGGISTSPPVHLVLDMDFQPKLKAQSESDFPGWTDHRSDRLPVPGTVAQGSIPADPKLLVYKKADGSYVAENPLPLTEAVLARGRERFDIYCSVCHGYSGRGGTGAEAHGMVGKRWPAGVVIPSFHERPGVDPRVPNLRDGEIFEVISKGKNNNSMPSYARMLKPEDRWAVIHYIRALQKLGKQ